MKLKLTNFNIRDGIVISRKFADGTREIYRDPMKHFSGTSTAARISAYGNEKSWSAASRDDMAKMFAAHGFELPT